MLSHSKTPHHSNLLFGLTESLNIHHPFYILEDKIDWNRSELSFAPLFYEDNGHPAKPIRLMVGLLTLKRLRNVSSTKHTYPISTFLLTLKHLRNVSDKSAVEQ